LGDMCLLGAPEAGRDGRPAGPRPLPGDASVGKDHPERAALPRLAFDGEPRLVAFEHVLDDGEAEAGAAGLARAAAVDAVEALGEARDVLRLDADAGVGHRVFGTAVGQRVPGQDDAAARRV